MKNILTTLGASMLLTVSAHAQGLFSEKFKSCTPAETCIYCGDSAAYYKKDLGKHIEWALEHSPNAATYDFRNFDVLYELYIDSNGHTCVPSIKSLGGSFSWAQREDIRRALTNMSDWVPATTQGVPVNSTIVLEIAFRNNFFFMKALPIEDIDKQIKK